MSSQFHRAEPYIKILASMGVRKCDQAYAAGRLVAQFGPTISSALDLMEGVPPAVIEAEAKRIAASDLRRFP